MKNRPAVRSFAAFLSLVVVTVTANAQPEICDPSVMTASESRSALQGTEAERSGKTEKALEIAARLVSDKNRCAATIRGLILRANVNASHGNFQAAIADADKVGTYQLTSESRQFYVLARMRIYNAASVFEKASETAMDLLLGGDLPGSRTMAALMAKAFAKTGTSGDAIQALITQQQTQPNTLDRVKNMAILRYEIVSAQGNSELAVAILRNLSETLAKSELPAHKVWLIERTLLQLYFEQGAHEDASATLDVLASLKEYKPRSSDYFARAWLAFKADDLNGAKDWLERMRKTDKKEADVRADALTAAINGEMLTELYNSIVETGPVYPIVDEEPNEFPLPRYPKRAAQTGIQGDCQILFDVTPAGKVINVQAICSHGAFRVPSEKAIRKISFPALPSNVPQLNRIDVTYPMTYRLGI